MAESEASRNAEVIEVEAMGGKLKASPDSIIRTVASIGTLVLLGGVLYWEAMHGRPAMIDKINTGWRDADEKHQTRLVEMQQKADARLDNLVERHADAIQGLRDILLQQRKIVGSPATAEPQP